MKKNIDTFISVFVEYTAFWVITGKYSAVLSILIFSNLNESDYLFKAQPCRESYNLLIFKNKLKAKFFVFLPS